MEHSKTGEGTSSVKIQNAPGKHTPTITHTFSRRQKQLHSRMGRRQLRQIASEEIVASIIITMGY